MKNVLFLVSDNLVRPCGGVAERLRQVLPTINEKHNCFVFGSGYHGNYKGIPMGGLEEYLLKDKIKIEGPPLQIIVTSYINEFIDNKIMTGPDIVVAIDHANILPGFNVARYWNAKFIVEFDLALFSYQKQYNPNELTGDNKFYANFVLNCERFGIQKADKVVLCSDYYKKELPIKPNNEPIVIANGINPEEWDAVTTKFQFPGNFKNNLLFIGRLHTQKGVQDILKVDLPPDTAIHFAGWDVGSNLYNDVIAKTKKSNNFFHLGFMTGEKKIEVVKSATAMLFPSHNEPWGISGMEAVIAKIPLITTRVGGIGEYVSENDCFVCKANSKDIERAINDLLSTDHVILKEKIDRAYSNIQNFTWKKIANKFIDLFSSV